MFACTRKIKTLRLNDRTLQVQSADTNASIHPVGVRDDDERATFSSTRMPYITPQFTEDLHVQWDRNGESRDFRTAFGDSENDRDDDTTDTLRSFDTAISEDYGSFDSATSKCE